VVETGLDRELGKTQDALLARFVPDARVRRVRWSGRDATLRTRHRHAAPVRPWWIGRRVRRPWAFPAYCSPPRTTHTCSRRDLTRPARGGSKRLPGHGWGARVPPRLCRAEVRIWPFTSMRHFPLIAIPHTHDLLPAPKSQHRRTCLRGDAGRSPSMPDPALTRYRELASVAAFRHDRRLDEYSSSLGIDGLEQSDRIDKRHKFSRTGPCRAALGRAALPSA
jgi:hypothetical protein